MLSRETEARVPVVQVPVGIIDSSEYEGVRELSVSEQSERNMASVKMPEFD